MSALVARSLIARHATRLVAPVLLRRSASASMSVTHSLSRGGPQPCSLRVVTYNVLSSHLGAADYFTSCAPANLVPAVRLQRVLEKLEGEVQRGSVICLQEVSMSWYGPLTTFFAQRGFTFLSHLYGSPFNNYMGVGLAFQTSRFAVESVDVSRVSDGLPRPRKPPPLTGLAKLRAKVWERVEKARLALGGARPSQDEWAAARSKFNSLVFAKLRDNRTQALVAVACFHMPCVFFAPKQMTIHAGLVAQKALALAAAAPPAPLVLAGDFNFKPRSAQYAMLVEGAAPEGEDAPDAASGPAWSPVPGQRLRSAYALAHGAEADFTNWSKVKQEDEFVDTLDYVFVSEGVQVLDADELPRRDALPGGGPLPTATQPSDHLMLAATIRV